MCRGVGGEDVVEEAGGGGALAEAKTFYLELFKKDFRSVGARNKSLRLGYRFIEVRGIIFLGQCRRVRGE